MLRLLCGLLLVTGVCLAAGCGSKVSSAVALGTVMIDGKPLADAELQFVPKSDTSLGAHTTVTGPDGTFTLKGGASNSPLRPGSYVVVVNKWSDDSNKGSGMDSMKSQIPETYRVQATTPLKVEIKEGENALGTLNLSSKTMQQQSQGSNDANMQMK